MDSPKYTRSTQICLIFKGISPLCPCNWYKAVMVATFLLYNISEENFRYLPGYCSGYKEELDLDGFQKAEMVKAGRIIS